MKKILLTLSIISIFNYVLASETESLSDTESISSQQTDTEEIDIPINIITKLVEIDEYEKLKSELEAQKRSNRIWKIATAASAIVGIGCALLAKSLFNALKEKATTVVFAPTINLISK